MIIFKADPDVSEKYTKNLPANLNLTDEQLAGRIFDNLDQEIKDNLGWRGSRVLANKLAKEAKQNAGKDYFDFMQDDAFISTDPKLKLDDTIEDDFASDFEVTPYEPIALEDMTLKLPAKPNASSLHKAYDEVLKQNPDITPEEFIEKAREEGLALSDNKINKFIELRKGDGKQQWLDKKAQQKDAFKSSKTSFNAGGILRLNKGGNTNGILAMNKGGTVYKRKRGVICG